MAVSISISITQNSQNVANNTSNVTVTVKCSWTNGSHNALVNASGIPQAKGWVKINGTSYDFASTFNTGKTSSGSQTICTKSNLTIPHNSDGTKTLSCSASYTTGVSSGTVTASASKVLTTIPRKSTLSVGNGTLGTAQTLTISEKASAFNHKLYYSCGNSGNVYILGSASATSSTLTKSWTPPLSLASQNTTGTSLSIKFTLQTYSGSTLIGSNSYTKTFTIPITNSALKPTCTISVSDSTTYYNLFGAYVQGVSKFKVTVTPTIKYNSPIASYSVKANDTTYNSSSFTTDVLKKSGSLSVAATIKDKRGATGTGTSPVQTVLAYSKPSITSLTARRVNDADGLLDNPEGEYIKVGFNAKITALNDKNTATYKLEYKKTTEKTYTTVNLTSLSGLYTVADSYIFKADPNSAYNIRLTATDTITSTPLATTIASSSKFMSWRPEGNGLAFGKRATRDGYVDFGFKIWADHGELITSPVELLEGADLDDLTTPGHYVTGNAAVSGTILNKPLWTDGTTSTGYVCVSKGGVEGQAIQHYFVCSKVLQIEFQRVYYQGSWGSWEIVSGSTSWTNLTIASGFEAHSSTVGPPKYKVSGGVVTITGAVTPTTAFTSTTTDVKIASGIQTYFRPATSMTFVCQGSGMYRWLLTIKSDGSLYMSRYGASTYAEVAVGAWLTFTVTYCL